MRALLLLPSACTGAARPPGTAGRRLGHGSPGRPAEALRGEDRRRGREPDREGRARRAPGPSRGGDGGGRRGRQRVPCAPDAAGSRRHDGVRLTALGARRLARREPHDHGRHRDPQPVPPLRAHERLQPGDGALLRPLRRRLLGEVRRPALLAARRREPAGHGRRPAARLECGEPHRRERGRGGPPARRGARLVDRHRAPHLLRPRREPDRGHRAALVRRPAGPRRLAARRRAEPDLHGPPEPRSDRRELRGRPRGRAGELRHQREERPRRADVPDDARHAGAVADDRVVLRERRRARGRRAVPGRRPPIERPRRRRRLRDGRHPVRPPARRPRPRAAAGAGGLGRPALRRDGGGGPRPAHGDVVADRRRPQPGRGERLERSGRGRAAGRARLRGRLRAGRRLGPGSLGGGDTALRRGRPAPRLERRQPGGDAWRRASR